MEEEKKRDVKKKVIIIVLSFVVLTPVLILAYVWNREWFDKIWNQLKDKLDNLIGKDKKDN